MNLHGYRYDWLENRLYRRLFIVAIAVPALLIVAVFGAIEAVGQSWRDTLREWR